LALDGFLKTYPNISGGTIAWGCNTGFLAGRGYGKMSAREAQIPSSLEKQQINI
jgi:hypothetical protein